MRLTALTPMGRRVDQVFCNGTRVINCVEVDTDEGWADYMIRTPVGSIRQRRTGTIEIKWLGDEPGAKSYTPLKLER